MGGSNVKINSNAFKSNVPFIKSRTPTIVLYTFSTSMDPSLPLRDEVE